MGGFRRGQTVRLALAAAGVLFGCAETGGDLRDLGDGPVPTAPRDGGLTPPVDDSQDVPCDRAAFDYPGNGRDEDCEGGDSPLEDPCDGPLLIQSADPLDGARALGLCRVTTEDSGEWGVLEARYTTADGAGELDDPLQVGLLSAFGQVTPREGERVLALSSGVARVPGQPEYTEGCDDFDVGPGLLGSGELGTPSAPPRGFPKESEACGVTGSELLYNAAALELRIRVPSNARALAFDSNFFTYEYPDFVCSEFNDFFAALLTPLPASLQGRDDDNIVFDQDGNPVSVNFSFLQVCEPGEQEGRTFTCPQGPQSLQGTGFGTEAACGPGDLGVPRGASGWLRTVAPVEPGSIITLRFAIWDSGDGDLDSTVLVDHFRWLSNEDGQESVVETVPII